MQNALFRRAVSLVAAFLVAAPAVGQGLNQVHRPAPMRSDDSVLRRYEAAQLRSLLNRCKAVNTPTWDAWESSPSAGVGWRVQGKSSEPNVNQYVRVSIDERKAEWVSYQQVDGSDRLWLKLALPRDYGRCRVVTNDAGEIRLEVANKVQLSDPSLTTLWRGIPASAEPECGTKAPYLRVRQDSSGPYKHWPLCSPTQTVWAQQVERATLELFGEATMTK